MEEYKKKYEQAMLRMNKWVEGSEIVDPKEVAEFVFPELKESEDERIKRCIGMCLTDANEQRFKDFNTTLKDCLSWLEKQGEHQEYPKDVIDNATSFLANRNDGMPEEEAKDIVNAIITVLNPSYWPKKGEQKPAFCHHEVDFSGCSEEYRKAYYDGWNNCNQQHDQLEAEQKPAWSEEDEKMWSTISDLLWEGYKLSDKKVSWNKIRCWLFPKIKSLKERVQHQPKQEWSEEDEKTFRSLSKALARISSNTRTDSTSINYSFFIEIEWLKSLKERYTWKPSEEQMKALNYVINLMASSESPTENDYYYNVLKVMRTQLKKLK